MNIINIKFIITVFSPCIYSCSNYILLSTNHWFLISVNYSHIQKIEKLLTLQNQNSFLLWLFKLPDNYQSLLNYNFPPANLLFFSTLFLSMWKICEKMHKARNWGWISLHSLNIYNCPSIITTRKKLNTYQQVIPK